LKLSEQVLETAQEKIKGHRTELMDYVTDRYEKLNDIGIKIIRQIEDKFAGKKVDDKIVSYFVHIPFYSATDSGISCHPLNSAIQLINNILNRAACFNNYFKILLIVSPSSFM